ncbi:MAG: bifunctional folylpolyglutamate synthase/dihydrofolate synthase [Deltaproteobacteria bacterium]|nr:bifunctional folylpolyglutamate synthase/dihydrofolate synthase [Deltaproteobacteria bacterium]
MNEERYIEAVRWLYGLQPRGIRLELDRMRAACALAGDPQKSLRVIHVAGTNGKGSTSATVERIAREAGLRTGLYTSPHLHSFTERVRIDGVPIAKDEVVSRVDVIRGLLALPGAPELTFFEVTTLLAFMAFAERPLDLVVLEVGLGGRLDATNVIERPLACVITHVAFDHQAYLGNTLLEIAGEKAGIVKAGVPVIHGATDPEDFGAQRRGLSGRTGEREGALPVQAGADFDEPRAADVVDARAAALGAPSVALGRELSMTVTSAELGILDVALGESRVTDLMPGLVGRHQRNNAALAVGAFLAVPDMLPIDGSAMRRGVSSVEWPGRLETVTKGEHTFLFDAAHNLDGARSLVSHLIRIPHDAARVLVFGAMADKDWTSMLLVLQPHVDAIVTVAPPLARAEKAEVIAEAVGGSAAPSVIDGVEEAKRRAGEGGTVIVCGSIFVLAEARAHVLGLAQEPLIAM